MKRWQNVLISPESSIEQAIKVIDKSGLKIALVVEATQKLFGIVTDGDVRRGLLRHIPLSASVREIVQASPVTARGDENRDDLLRQIQRKVADGAYMGFLGMRSPSVVAAPAWRDYQVSNTNQWVDAHTAPTR
mgnify:CR=1 FL=1